MHPRKLLVTLEANFARIPLATKIVKLFDAVTDSAINYD